MRKKLKKRKKKSKKKEKPLIFLQLSQRESGLAEPELKNHYATKCSLEIWPNDKLIFFIIYISVSKSPWKISLPKRMEKFMISSFRLLFSKTGKTLRGGAKEINHSSLMTMMINSTKLSFH